MFGGPMPERFRFTVEGFAEGARDELIWNEKKHFLLPVTNLDFDMVTKVVSVPPKHPLYIEFPKDIEFPED